MEQNKIHNKPAFKNNMKIEERFLKLILNFFVYLKLLILTKILISIVYIFFI